MCATDSLHVSLVMSPTPSLTQQVAAYIKPVSAHGRLIVSMLGDFRVLSRRRPYSPQETLASTTLASCQCLLKPVMARVWSYLMHFPTFCRLLYASCFMSCCRGRGRDPVVYLSPTTRELAATTVEKTIQQTRASLKHVSGV